MPIKKIETIRIRGPFVAFWRFLAFCENADDFNDDSTEKKGDRVKIVDLEDNTVFWTFQFPNNDRIVSLKYTNNGGTPMLFGVCTNGVFAMDLINESNFYYDFAPWRFGTITALELGGDTILCKFKDQNKPVLVDINKKIYNLLAADYDISKVVGIFHCDAQDAFIIITEIGTCSNAIFLLLHKENKIEILSTARDIVHACMISDRCFAVLSRKNSKMNLAVYYIRESNSECTKSLFIEVDHMSTRIIPLGTSACVGILSIGRGQVMHVEDLRFRRRAFSVMLGSDVDIGYGGVGRVHIENGRLFVELGNAVTVWKVDVPALLVTLDNNGYRYNHIEIYSDGVINRLHSHKNFVEGTIHHRTRFAREKSTNTRVILNVTPHGRRSKRKITLDLKSDEQVLDARRAYKQVLECNPITKFNLLQTIMHHKRKENDNKLVMPPEIMKIIQDYVIKT